MDCFKNDYIYPEFVRKLLLKKRSLKEIKLTNEQIIINSLTQREREILALILKAKHNIQISKMLGIGVRTVERIRSEIMDKFGAHNVVELIEFCHRNVSVPRSTSMQLPRLLF